METRTVPELALVEPEKVIFLKQHHLAKFSFLFPAIATFR
jgi:hypothetical protein